MHKSSNDNSAYSISSAHRKRAIPKMVLNNLTMAWITVSHISILQATCGSHYLKIVMLFDISVYGSRSKVLR